MIKEDRKMTTIDKLIAAAGYVLAHLRTDRRPRAEGCRSSPCRYLHVNVCCVADSPTRVLLGCPACVLPAISCASRETPFDFLKIDIQGAEKIALTGAKETLKTVEVILAETSNVEYNKGAPSTVEMLSFFDSIGFQIFDVVRRPLCIAERINTWPAGHSAWLTRLLACLLAGRSHDAWVCAWLQVELHRKGQKSGQHGILFQMDFLFVRKDSSILQSAEKYWHNGG